MWWEQLLNALLLLAFPMDGDETNGTNSSEAMEKTAENAQEFLLKVKNNNFQKIKPLMCF